MTISNKAAREAAWRAGKVRFFTGLPCKHGHIAERFVSSGGCVKCIAPYKLRRNAFTKEAAPYATQNLWVRNTYTAENYAALEVYLQQCIDAFDRVTYPHLAPLMHSAPQQEISEHTAPPGAGVLPSFDSLPSAARQRSEKCEHGVEEGFCEICE